MTTFSAGDEVGWDTSQGETSGTAVDVRVEDFTFDAQQFRASEDDPHSIVEHAESGAQAAPSGDALSKA